MKQPGEEKKRTGSLADGNRQDVCHHVLERATLWPPDATTRASRCMVATTPFCGVPSASCSSASLCLDGNGYSGKNT